MLKLAFKLATRSRRLFLIIIGSALVTLPVVAVIPVTLLLQLPVRLYHAYRAYKYDEVRDLFLISESHPYLSFTFYLVWTQPGLRINRVIFKISCWYNDRCIARRSPAALNSFSWRNKLDARRASALVMRVVVSALTGVPLHIYYNYCVWLELLDDLSIDPNFKLRVATSLYVLRTSNH